MQCCFAVGQLRWELVRSLCWGCSAQPVRAELVGYWNFDGNVDDHSGLDNHGELFDAVYVDDVPAAIGSGQSLSFEADSDYVFVENANGDLDSEEFTLAMFIYDRGQVGAMERLTSREGDTFETAINVHPPFNGMGEYAFYSPVDGAGWQWGEEIPPLEEWQHVAYVANADDQTMRIYVDGELMWETVDPWSVFPTGFMHIGNRHNGLEGFDGLIDDVAIWDEVLDEDAIMAIAQGGVAAYLNPVKGDFNGDGVCDASDIDVLAMAIRDGDTNGKYDLNGDGSVNSTDHSYLVRDIKSTWIGDADLNGEFNSADLVVLLAAGAYEANIEAGWAAGDFDGNGLVNASDLVAALSDGGYEQGPRAAVSRRAGAHRVGDECCGPAVPWYPAPSLVSQPEVVSDCALVRHATTRPLVPWRRVWADAEAVAGWRNENDDSEDRQRGAHWFAIHF